MKLQTEPNRLPRTGRRVRPLTPIALLWSVTLCPAQPYPEPGWRTTADLAQVRTSKEHIAAFDSWLKQQGGDHWAAVVIKGGFLVYEGRGPRAWVHQKNDCGSIVKPLQGTVLGAALLQKRLKSIDEIASRYWSNPYQTPHENDRAITFRQFAQYRDRWNDPAPPGSYRYNNSSATAAAACIAGLFGRVDGPKPIGIVEATREHVMKPISAEWDLWHWDASFTDNASNPGPRMVLESSVSELAKLGYLWLRKGVWKNRRIFSEDFYREATTDWSPDGTDQFGMVGHYGYWWFVNKGRFWLPDLPEDTFYHIGNGDPVRATLLLIVPAYDMVAVMSMKRLSDSGKWDVIQNSRLPSNEGPRAFSRAVSALHQR
jgi:CubicO group peptidase (beta-lactamase class C family)